MEITDEITDQQYLDFLAKFPEVGFLQSPEWGELYRILGDKIIRSGIVNDGQLIASWLAIVKTAKRARYLEVPGGPVMDYHDETLVKMVFDELRQVARKNHCAFVRFRAPVEENSETLQILQQNGAKKAPMHLHAEHTSIVDITPAEETLLTNMRRQTRYEVRQVDKKGIDLTSRQPSETDIDQFYKMQLETAKRHGFVPPSCQYLQATRRAFGDKLRIYYAHQAGELLNVALVIFWGEEAIYHEAASTVAARRQPGAYGIVWRAMRDAKAQGCKRFNLWGIAYNNNPKHRYAGVTTFKRGFGGRDVAYLPAQDIVVKPLNYSLNWLFETARRKRRGL